MQKVSLNLQSSLMLSINLSKMITKMLLIPSVPESSNHHFSVNFQRSHFHAPGTYSQFLGEPEPMTIPECTPLFAFLGPFSKSSFAWTKEPTWAPGRARTYCSHLMHTPKHGLGLLTTVHFLKKFTAPRLRIFPVLGSFSKSPFPSPGERV